MLEREPTGQVPAPGRSKKGGSSLRSRRLSVMQTSHRCSSADVPDDFRVPSSPALRPELTVVQLFDYASETPSASPQIHHHTDCVLLAFPRKKWWQRWQQADDHRALRASCGTSEPALCIAVSQDAHRERGATKWVDAANDSNRAVSWLPAQRS